MAYEGYLELGGTEIINAARTEAYVGSLMPTFGLKGCQDCTGLTEALGAVNVLGDEQRQGLLGMANHNLANEPRPSVENAPYSEWSWTPASGATITSAAITNDASSVQALPGAYRVVGTAAASTRQWGSIVYSEDSLANWGGGADTGGAATRMYVSLAVQGTTVSAVSIVARFYDAGGALLLTSETVREEGNYANWRRIGVEVQNVLLRNANRVVITATPVASTASSGSATLRFSNVLIQANTAAGGTEMWTTYADHQMEDSLAYEYRGVGLDFNSLRTVLLHYDVARQVIEQREYQSPVADSAPWVDPADPDSANFWGLYPLEWTGVDEGTRETPITELIGDGAVAGRSRSASRNMRFEGVLLGKDERALESGLAWLNRALDAARCEGAGQPCRGESMRFFSSCPPACGYEPCMDNPISFDFTGWTPGDDYPEEWREWVPTPAGDVYFDAAGAGQCAQPGLVMNGFVDGREYTFNRKVGGFVPGEWYTVRFNITNGVGITTASVAEGPEVSVPAVAFWNVCDTRSIFTMSWRATSDVQTMQVKFRVPDVDPTFQDPNGRTRVMLHSLEVERVVSPTVVYSTTFPDNGSFLNGWDLRPSMGSISASVQRLWQGTGAAVRLTATAASQTASAGDLVYRWFRNLIPGQRYRATISTSLGSTGMPNPALSWGVDFLGTEPVVWDTTSSVPSATTVVEFVAEQTSHLLSLRLTAPYALPTVGSALYVELTFASLERVTDPNERLPHPNPGRRYERNMYRVTAIQGPRVEERYSKECGAMMRVSFGLNAGVPFVYGPIQEVGSAFGGSSSLIPALACADGGQIRTNLVPNPSVETNLTGWIGTGVGTFTRGTGSVASCGSYGANRQVPAGNSGYLAEVSPAQNIPITGGYPYTFSINFRKGWIGLEPESTPGSIEIRWNTGEWSTLGFSAERGIRNRRLSITAYAPEGATSATLYVRYSPGVNTSWGFSLDCALFELGTATLPYFDGSFPNAAWNGTPHASSSTLTPVEEDYLLDPNCPPLPAPPQPPQIPEDCWDEIGSWQRYAIAVPKIMVPVNSSALPIVHLSAGDVAARQVRMRWYPDPEGLGAGELVECAFESEITVSYMPAFSELVVDTITREATASRAGMSDRNANHLLYGPDNGPVEWPELRCGIPYIFTLDVSTDDDVGELDVFLDLGLRV